MVLPMKAIYIGSFISAFVCELVFWQLLTLVKQYFSSTCWPLSIVIVTSCCFKNVWYTYSLYIEILLLFYVRNIVYPCFSRHYRIHTPLTTLTQCRRIFIERITNIQTKTYGKWCSPKNEAISEINIFTLNINKWNSYSGPRPIIK